MENNQGHISQNFILKCVKKQNNSTMLTKCLHGNATNLVWSSCTEVSPSSFNGTIKTICTIDIGGTSPCCSMQVDQAQEEVWIWHVHHCWTTIISSWFHFPLQHSISSHFLVLLHWATCSDALPISANKCRRLWLIFSYCQETVLRK